MKTGGTRPGMSTPCIEWNGSRDKKGYGRFNAGTGKEPRYVLAHRFALELAGQVDPRPALHQCDNPPCCNIQHLRYGTLAENNAEMVERGRMARGEQYGYGVLTEALVSEARERVGAGETIASVARDIGVHAYSLGQAVRGVNWAHLPGVPPPREYGGQAKLTRPMVEEARMRRTVGESVSGLARSYGVSESSMRRLLLGESYK